MIAVDSVFYSTFPNPQISVVSRWPLSFLQRAQNYNSEPITIQINVSANAFIYSILIISTLFLVIQLNICWLLKKKKKKKINNEYKDFLIELIKIINNK